MSVKKYLDIVGLEHLLDYLPTFKIKVTCDAEFATETITCTNNIKTYSAECPSTSPYVLTFTVNAPGTWTISGTDSVLGETFSVDVTVTTLGMVETELHVITTPEGATVTPTDDIQTWLKCANLEKSYTTLAEVLADQETYETLLADSNACNYMARSTTWTGDPTIKVPSMTSNTTPSGEAFASSTYSSSYPAYYAFDGNDTTFWSSQSSGNQYVGYKFTSAVNINKLYIYPNLSSGTDYEFKLQGSNDNSDWIDLKTFEVDGLTPTYIDVDSNDSYMYYRVFRDSGWQAFTIQFYKAGITTSETAMRLLGKYDYACQKLLGNSTWAETIFSSDYWEYVCNDSVPKMTSNTSPRGSVGGSGAFNSSYPAWYSFDRNDSTSPALTTASYTAWIQYDFGYSSHIYGFCALFTTGGSGEAMELEIKYSDDNSTFESAGTYRYEASDNNHTKYYKLNADYGAHRYWRMIRTLDNHSTNWSSTGNTVQFYGHKQLINSYEPLVPTMTSATAPRGEVIYSSQYDSTYAAWKVFSSDTGLSTGSWGPASNDIYGIMYVGYKFPIPTVADRVSLYTNTSSYIRIAKFRIMARNETDLDWTTLLTVTDRNTNDLTYYNFTNSNAYTYYKLVIDEGGSGTTVDSLKLTTLQFYAKLDKTIIHSAPYDTIYYKNNGINIPLCSTNKDGIGEMDLSGLLEGTYTLYSSVAKDLSGSLDDYSKTKCITKSPYGETKEIWLMPNGKILYWYGLGSENFATWKNSTGGALSKNTYNISIGHYTGSSPWSCTYVYTELTGYSKVKCMLSVSTSTNSSMEYLGYASSTSGAQTRGTTGKTVTNMNCASTFEYQLKSSDISNVGYAYVGIFTDCYPTTEYIYAIWLD